MSKFHKTKEFKNLQEEWESKLKSSGFKDIEQDEDNLKVWSSYFGNQYSKEAFEARQQYYELAEKFMAEYDFTQLVRGKSMKEARKFLSFYKRVWRRHASGMQIVVIAKKLDASYTKVRDCIEKLEKVMLRYYEVMGRVQI